MSSTTIMLFYKEGVNEISFPNSWGGAARIWGSLYDKHIKRSEYDNWLNNQEELWKLIYREDLEDWEKNILTFTFDYALVKKENFKNLSLDLYRFLVAYPTNSVCHLKAWADLISKEDCDYIGLHSTSVSYNLWYEYDAEDSGVIYDIENGDKHFFIYETIWEKNDGN